MGVLRSADTDAERVSAWVNVQIRLLSTAELR